MQDLGLYQFTTGPDRTGLNPGNLTSVLATGDTINPAYFECYRLLLDTSSLPTALPQVVQSTTYNSMGGVGPPVLTFPKAVTAGNTLVLFVASFATGTVATVATVTTGASADHWGKITAASAATAAYIGNLDTWVCPQLAVTGTTINTTLTAASGSQQYFAYAIEVSGCLQTTTAAAAVDTALTGAAPTYQTQYTVGATNTTSGNDLWLCFEPCYNPTNNGVMSTTTVSPALTPLAPISYAFNGAYFQALAHYGGTGSGAGVTLNYGMTCTISSALEGAYITLLPGAASASGAIPFAVSIDGHGWDSQTTTAGVGYTYNIGQSPLALNNGNTIYILWQLPSATYRNYANLLRVSGWFRYDPAKR